MKLGIVMDSISRINITKDSSFAMLLAAQKRELEIYYIKPGNLFLDHNTPCAKAKPIKVDDNPSSWFATGKQHAMELNQLDIILMRQDPPVTTEYYVATYILEHAQQQGVLVVNDPRSLRDVNEKMYCTWFAEVMAPTLVSKHRETLLEFLNIHQDIIVKPLHSMGGDSVFRLQIGDPNTTTILESVSSRYQEFIMAQRYIPEITKGDKRILLIDGEPVPYALARIPKSGETRGNLAAGGNGIGISISERDKEICSIVGKPLRDKGLVFVGLDVIGDYLTEINVTSPTCIRELDRIYDLDIAGDLIDCLIEKSAAR